MVQGPNGDENKLKKSKVLKRLESWSSSNSGWSTASTDTSYGKKSKPQCLDGDIS